MDRLSGSDPERSVRDQVFPCEKWAAMPLTATGRKVQPSEAETRGGSPHRRLLNDVFSSHKGTKTLRKSMLEKVYFVRFVALCE